MASIESLANKGRNLAPITRGAAVTTKIGEMEFEWRGEAFKEQINEAVAVGITDGAVHVARAMKRNIGVQGPPTSLPGAFPHMDTTSLNRSISVDVATAKSLVAAAGVAREARNSETGVRVDDYALKLEFGGLGQQPRPWAVRTLREETGKLFGIIVESTARTLGGGLKGVR